MLRFSFLMTLIASVLAVHAPLQAQPGPRQYRRLIREALHEFDASNWAEARALFRRAHEVYPNARSARGLGMAAFEERDYVAAQEMLQEALTLETRRLSAHQRRETEALLERTRAFLGRFLFALEPPSAAIEIDGAPAPEPGLDGTLLLPLGEHLVVATLEGHEPARRRIVVVGGEQETLHLTLTEIGRPQASVSEPTADGTLLTAGIAILIGAIGPLGASLGGLGWLVDRESELSRCRGVGVDQLCLNEETLTSEHSASVGFTATMTTTMALALGTGLVLLMLGLDDAAAGESAWACGPAPLGVACSGRY